jgi:RimJ/RimL family protein N-acetyltransferase
MNAKKRNPMEDYLMKTIFLETEKITLRPFEKDDIEFFLKWNNDFSTRGKIGETRPTSYADVEKTIDRKKEDSIWFAIVEKSSGSVIGETGLLRMFPAWGTTDLSIIIPEKEKQGKGYGKDAIYLMMDYAFGYLHFNRIAIGVVGFNKAPSSFTKKSGSNRKASKNKDIITTMNFPISS